MSHAHDASNLLEQSFDECSFSEEFKKCCRRMGYHTLNDIIGESPEHLFNKPDFNYNWLGELVEFLSKHQLLYLFQPLPGRSPEKP
jgi:hypothetical protein